MKVANDNNKQGAELGVERKKKWNLGGCVCATAIVAIIVAAAALGVAIPALTSFGKFTSPRVHLASAELPPSPFVQFLAATGAPLAMTLPNDLTPYLGKTYRIFSASAQPHTVTISAGTLATTWDGVNTIATFGGAKGDGFEFTVIAKDLVTVLPPKNVGFS